MGSADPKFLRQAENCEWFASKAKSEANRQMFLICAAKWRKLASGSLASDSSGYRSEPAVGDIRSTAMRSRRSA
jgi:hypothetical protein